MELQEAINHALEVSEKEEECDICKSEHKQLADWLVELKDLRNILGDNYNIYELKDLIEVCRGLTPHQVQQIFEEWSHYLNFSGKMNAIEDAVGFIYDDGSVDYNRLRDIVEADRDGRCVVLPCKPSGVTVYQLRGKKHARGCGVSPRHVGCATVWADGHFQLEHQGAEPCRDRDFGKTWFLEPEAAEAAMKGETNANP